MLSCIHISKHIGKSALCMNIRDGRIRELMCQLGFIKVARSINMSLAFSWKDLLWLIARHHFHTHKQQVKVKCGERTVQHHRCACRPASALPWKSQRLPRSVA